MEFVPGTSYTNMCTNGRSDTSLKAVKQGGLERHAHWARKGQYPDIVFERFHCFFYYFAARQKDLLS